MFDIKNYIWNSYAPGMERSEAVMKTATAGSSANIRRFLQESAYVLQQWYWMTHVITSFCIYKGVPTEANVMEPGKCTGISVVSTSNLQQLMILSVTLLFIKIFWVQGAKSSNFKIDINVYYNHRAHKYTAHSLKSERIFSSWNALFEKRRHVFWCFWATWAWAVAI